jgi:hypothetical protein
LYLFLWHDFKFGVNDMSDFNWCHGPRCHKQHTQDRIRGVKGSKVLRTKKIKVQDLSKWYYSQGWENHFCKLGCLMDFIKEHITSIIALGPRTECLETPINVTQEKYSNHWGNHTNTKIEVDNTRTNDIG